MYKRTILAGMILMGVGLVGCQSAKGANVSEYSADVKKVKVGKNEIKVTYEDFKINIPKSWNKSKVDDVDIYKLEDRNANLSIAKVGNEEDLNVYISGVKEFIDNKLGVKDIDEEDLLINDIVGKVLAYNYKVSDVDDINVYQVCTKIKEGIYVFTLVSNEDSCEQDITNVKSVLDTIG